MVAKRNEVKLHTVLENVTLYNKLRILDGRPVWLCLYQMLIWNVNYILYNTVSTNYNKKENMYVTWLCKCFL